jgi:putative membrane protein
MTAGDALRTPDGGSTLLENGMDSSLLSYSLTGIVAHLVYFGIASVAVVVFVAIYVAVTPHHEFRLIRQGNTAAALSLGGAILGYTVPLAKAVSQSESIADMLLWSGVALVAQLVAYGITRLVLPQLSSNVDEGKTASGIFLAAISIAIGLLNAAAMTE